MLSERVLDELVRRGELSEALAKALWPDLSVESKLQLLAAYQADFSSTTPDWVTDFALDDKSPVVQYFALRCAYLRAPLKNVPDEFESQFQVSEEDAARHAKAHAIEHPLVKAAVSSSSPIGDTEHLLQASQLERLATVRNKSTLSLDALIDFLGEAVGKVADRELAAVAYEYFLRPDIKREMLRGRAGFSDGGAAYFAGQGIKKGWEVARGAGPALTNVLASSLPTALGLATIKASDLATMPERVLVRLAYDNLGRKEVSDLHAMMLEHPDRFPKKAIEALESSSGIVGDDDADAQRERWLESPLGERATLEAVLALQQQVAKVVEELQEMRENPPKRGFFG